MIINKCFCCQFAKKTYGFDYVQKLLYYWLLAKQIFETRNVLLKSYSY